MAKASFYSEVSLLPHTLPLKQQSVWLQWADLAEPLDLTWKNDVGTFESLCDLVCFSCFSQLGVYSTFIALMELETNMFLLSL